MAPIEVYGGCYVLVNGSRVWRLSKGKCGNYRFLRAPARSRFKSGCFGVFDIVSERSRSSRCALRFRLSLRLQSRARPWIVALSYVIDVQSGVAIVCSGVLCLCVGDDEIRGSLAFCVQSGASIGINVLDLSTVLAKNARIAPRFSARRC